VVVVDPGVGSARKPIAVEAGDYRFVAPDNGVLTYALGKSDDIHVVELTNRSYRLPEMSNTFHGRDLFAPAAAHLISGVALDRLGERQDKLFRLPMPQLTVSTASLGGEVMHIDHFGNVITSIGPFRWVASDQLLLVPVSGKKDCALTISAPDTVIEIRGVTLPAVHRAYHETKQGELLALVGSSGYLEVAVNQGNAAARLDVTAGDQVRALIIS
jgi:S-adenosylmethionine hydrolase